LPIAKSRCLTIPKIHVFFCGLIRFGFQADF
jgi:hypothetical protein